MTTSHECTKSTVWGRANNKKYPRELFASPLNTHSRKRTLRCHSKKLKPSQASLFDLLPTDIHTDIKFWVSSLEHCDKFKTVVSCINTMCNPVLFAIPHGLWNPYHNFGFFR